MPVCKCFRGGVAFAEQSEWTQREHVEETITRQTMKVKRVPDEGRKGDRIDNEDTLQSIINTIRTKCFYDLRGTRAGTCVGSEIDRRSLATRQRSPILTPTFFLDVALSCLRIPPARRCLRDHDFPC